MTTTFLRVFGNLPVLALVTFAAWTVIAVLIDGWLVVAAAVAGVWMMLNAAILSRARQRHHSPARVEQPQEARS